MEPARSRTRLKHVERASGRILVDGSTVRGVADALEVAVGGPTCAPRFGPSSCDAAFAEHARDYRAGVAALAQAFDGMRAEAAAIAQLLQRAVSEIESADGTWQP